MSDCWLIITYVDSIIYYADSTYVDSIIHAAIKAIKIYAHLSGKIKTSHSDLIRKVPYNPNCEE